MSLRLAGHLPLQDMIAQTIESAKMKLAAAEEDKKDEKEKEKIRRLVEHEKKEHGGKVPSVEEEKLSFVIDLGDAEEVEKLASALDFVAEKLAGDSVDIGGESHQGGTVLPTMGVVPGKQPYKHDKARTGNIPLNPGMTSDPSQGSAATLMANDANRAPGGNAKGEFKTAAVERLQEALEKIALKPETYGRASARRVMSESVRGDMTPEELSKTVRGRQSDKVRTKIMGRYEDKVLNSSDSDYARSRKGFDAMTKEKAQKALGLGMDAKDVKAVESAMGEVGKKMDQVRKDHRAKQLVPHKAEPTAHAATSSHAAPHSGSSAMRAKSAINKPRFNKGRTAAIVGGAALAGYGAKKIMEKKSSVERLQDALEKAAESETTKDRARRWGRTGALAGVGANLGLHVATKGRYIHNLPIGMPIDAAAGYGIGRLSHRIIHGPSNDNQKVKKSSAEYILGKIAETIGGGMTLDSPSGQGVTPPSDAAGGNNVRSILESNQAVINMKKIDGKGPQKRMLSEVLSEPAWSKGTDSKVHENLQNASKGGVKIASSVKTAAARAFLRKVAEEGCTCGDQGECKYCKLQAATKKEKQSEGGMPMTTPPGMSGSM